MSAILDITKRRRSIRKFTDVAISNEEIKELLKPALLSPSSKNKRPWKFIVTSSKEKLQAIATCKPFGVKFIADANAAILITGNHEESDTWVEDCSIAATLIQWAAEERNIGSTWIQIRGRKAENGDDAEHSLKELFQIPSSESVLAVIALGHKEKDRKPYTEEDMDWSKVTFDNE
ncbi:nitroreductase family protein [Halosquirtibacter xylanolyticus]|uniref:nitroreductase family protein n=1 Tax=Halosquirtibacter xylanolyticus TaxID=3374599 RepID=UPI0037498FFB|nr:nitroreductase family protein [Prolixibacteraceae bacterium]